APAHAQTVIEANGSTSLVEVGSNFFFYPVGGSSGPELSFNGTPFVAAQFGGWTPIGVEHTASGYGGAWNVTGADQYSVWNTDSSGNYISNAIGVVLGSSVALESLESSFQQDLSGNGVIGIAQVASTPVNGACGSANGVAVTTAPTTGLCTAGTTTTVTGTGPRAWTRSRSNGGTNSSCSAPLQSGTGGVEIPGPSQTLFNNPFYTCLRNLYVATNGSDANDGSSPSTPWATIQHADTASRTGGDCINVAPGTYQQKVLIQHGGIAPASTGYVVYRCQTMDACHILAPGGGHLWGFKNNGNFVVVDGFELDGNNALLTDGVADTCIGTDDPTYGRGNSSYQAGASSHHIWVLNNIIHHCNLGGVGLSG